MKRPLVVKLVLGTLAVVLTVWVAMNTYWAETTLPASYKGEAASNPFYAAERFVENVGARARWDRVLTDTPADAVIVLTAWHWNLVEDRRERLERWVGAGGRLVVDRSLVGGEDLFERWAGIAQRFPEIDEDKDDDEESAEDPLGQESPAFRRTGGCRALRETTPGLAEGGGTPATFELCERLTDFSELTTTRPVAWALSDDIGFQALRIAVGQGSVTAINSVPFRNREFLRGEHAALLVAAAQLKPGDDVRFLSEEDHPSILTLAWIYGWPSVLLFAAFVVLALWRSGARFGPLAAVPDRARRSLAEQIRGTGQFVLRQGAGRSLHAAAVRALEEAARRRISRYERLSAAGRVETLSHLAGLDASVLGPAMQFSGPRRSHELRDALALLETARRRILLERSFGQKGSIHGNRVEHDHARG